MFRRCVGLKASFSAAQASLSRSSWETAGICAMGLCGFLVIKTDLATVKTDLATVKTDLATVKTDLQADLATVKTDLQADLATVKTDLATIDKNLRRSVPSYAFSQVARCS
jgi:septal ring factor EnvC (AmiA/AmiB activator)